ncbi:slipin family protein [Mycolicibacterium septicum DSM 44393]|uniref:Slipin family protein n=1 Tax=Mycolicibacterium septicum DSM 44393 TaxID=1341646 RepID=A0A7X6MV64_9MYCO|nr:slipin family protein [Mycolicibacterium septicum]NKZ14869.1 slipin family protein [Mycolicibacterium septicum DSM 44393]
MSMFTFNRITVSAGQCALEYKDGTLGRVLPPGRHRIDVAASVVRVEMREQVLTLAPQEVLTSDAVTLRITVALQFKVRDAVAYVEAAADPMAAVYLAAQIALRDLASAVTADEVMQRGNRIDADAIAAAARTAGARTGVQVIGAFVKDVIVPTEIRAAALQLATAKATGAAKLEAARAETAALRALANAGKLLDAHPALAQLQLIQHVPYGSKVVLALGTSDAVSPDVASDPE